MVTFSLFLVYPYFVEKPTDITVRSGETVAIKCSANGVPAPTVRLTKKFNKEQFPAVTENRFWFDKKRFGITNVKIEDTGFYVCHAYSEVGEVNITMVLTVNGMCAFYYKLLNPFWWLMFPGAVKTKSIIRAT